MSDHDFLMWIYHRLIRRHHEDPKYDYMIRFKEIIDAYKITGDDLPARLRNQGF